ncbi:MAG: hypothetical protein IKJ71_03455 [Bacteroidaceae bacterium]|nr:hypothetical protein [Bacteroidaceae bacterium]
MKKMFVAALAACAFLFVSCSSNVDKLVDIKKEQAEAVKELDLKKAAELEKEAAEIVKNLTAEEKEELAKRLLEK